MVSRRDGTKSMCEPMPAVSVVRSKALQTLLGTKREPGGAELEGLRSRWRALVQENAPFRVTTGEGLISAPADYFDSALLELASSEWRKVNRLIDDAFCHDKAYMQIGDLMLQARIVVLVEQGRLVAMGNLWEMRSCEVRLPDALSTG
jgi:hypothetical protein